MKHGKSGLTQAGFAAGSKVLFAILFIAACAYFDWARSPFNGQNEWKFAKMIRPNSQANSLWLTPQGQLHLASDADAPALPLELHTRLAAAFAGGSGHGLLLGANEPTTVLPPAWAWWRDVAARYVTAVCSTPEGAALDVATPDVLTLGLLVSDAPLMTGSDHLNPDVLTALWQSLDAALQAELKTSKLTLQDFLKARHPAWNQVGRVYFNLAENKKDADTPFAFLATYTPRLSAHGKAQHLPLSKALAKY